MSHTTRTTLAFAAGISLAINAASAGGGPLPGTITNIEAYQIGGWVVDSDYIGQSHFDLDTLLLQETVPEPLRGPGFPPEQWTDIVITVTRASGVTEPAMIAIDKLVNNATNHHWSDFHMELGLYVRANDLAPIDGLEFKTDPAPIEELDRFHNPPMSGVSGPFDVPSLWWFEDGPIPCDGLPHLGVDPGQSAQFWLGINVPDALFYPLNRGSTPGLDEQATFILRQHWTPTPGAVGLFAVAGACGSRRRRRSLA